MYEIKVNGLVMARKITKLAALALVSLKYHHSNAVTIERLGIVLWTSKEAL